MAEGSHLYRVPDTGGTAEIITSIDKSRKEIQHQLPYFLPDGRQFLFLATSEDTENSMVYAGSLGSEKRQPILKAHSEARYVQGHLVFLLGTTLTAQAFDPKRLTLSGEPFPVLENIRAGVN